MTIFPCLLFGLSFLFSQINKSEGMKCDVEKAINQHKKFREEKNPELSEIPYQPSLGCGLCTKDVCVPNGEEKECKKMSALKEFEWETDIFEFGLLGTFLPEDGSVKVVFSDDFYMRIEIKLRDGHNLTASLLFCSLEGGKKKPECNDDNYTIYKLPYFTREECFYLALGLMENNRFHFTVSRVCHHLASTMIWPDYIQHAEFLGFKFDVSETVRVTFHFDKDPSYTHEGVPVLLPCSQGGYAFDPDTTRFLEGDQCDNVYYKSSPLSGIPLLIEIFYENDENKYFEKLDGREKYTPAYTDGEKMTLKKEDMFPKSKPNEKLAGKERFVCHYVTHEEAIEENKTEAANTKEILAELEEIQPMFTEEKVDSELSDVHFDEDALIAIELEKLDDKEEIITTTTMKPEPATTPPSDAGAGGGADTSGSTKCFNNQVIKTVLKYILFLQLFIQQQ